MKVCSKCKELKAVELFSKNRTKKHGLQNQCKSCMKAAAAVNKEYIRAAQKEYYEANKEKLLGNMKVYYASNKEKFNASSKAWKKANREKVSAYNREYSQANPGKVNARTAKRRAAKLQRTPEWACLDSIKEFYTCAKDLQELTGIEFQVDHIVPLQGELVSGLHVETNLQILTASENSSKSNAFEVG